MGVIARWWRLATLVLLGAAGVGASVLVSGVGAAPNVDCTTQTTDNRVTVICDGLGGEVTLPGGREVTVDLAGGSGGAARGVPGGHGALVHGTWTPDEDTVVWVALGGAGLDGVGRFVGGFGGAPSIVVPRPMRDQLATRGPWWLFVAGGGGGRGTSPALGAGGDGGADATTGAGGDGGGGATGGTADGPGQGTTGGLPGIGPLGGVGLLGGGSGGSGYYGGGGGGRNQGGGGAGASSASVGTVTYATAPDPGDGWAQFSWTLPTAPQFTTATSTTFVAGSPGSFTVSATGDPTPALSATGLPLGLTFTDDGDGNGVISGQVPGGYGGDFDVTVRADNGIESAAVQHLQLHVDVEPTPPRDDPPAPPAPPFNPDLTPPVQTSESQQDPQLVPVAGKTVVVSLVSGTVLVTLPDGTTKALEDGEEIPVDSIVDARDGVVRLTAARDANGVVQTAVFWNSVFKVTQQADGPAGGRASAAAAKHKLLTELTLKQQPTGCGRKAHTAGKTGGGLWGDGKGRFRVRGQSSSATVRGTKWYVENRCDGTYTRVVRGVVAVRDFVKKQTIILRAGGTYTAKRRHQP
jgi:hypothetical protein